jgi:MFS transporter, putative metabolite:H+ symporter
MAGHGTLSVRRRIGRAASSCMVWTSIPHRPRRYNRQAPLVTSAQNIAARLDRLPATRALWVRVALLSLGGFFEFYDMFLAGYVAPGLVRSHILTATTPGLFGLDGVASFVSAFFAGLFLGTAFLGFLADRFGRRSIFTFSLLWYMAASAIMAFQTDAFGLNLWRFIAGIGVGVELVTIDTYIAEIVPKEFRGRAFALNQIVQFSAILIVALLAWLLVPHKVFGFDGWRVVVLIGSVGAGVVWQIRRVVPESPRWLARNGRPDEAERVVAHWEAQAISAGRVLAAPATAAVPNEEHGRLADIWRPPYLSRTAMLIVFNLFQTVGFYGFSNWVPTLLTTQGITVTASLGYTFIIAIAAPVGPALAWMFTDRIERKWLIVAGALGVACFGLAFGEVRSPPFLILFGVFLTLSNNIMSFSFHAYQPELYPTRIRGVAVGFVYSFSRLSAVFNTFVIAFVLGRSGDIGVFVLIAGCMVVVAMTIAALGPRTRNLPLEAISH